MRAEQQPSPTCLLFLLILLSAAIEAQSGLIIKSVKLLVRPAAQVERGTDLILTCYAEVSHVTRHLPKYNYTFYKEYMEDKPVFSIQTNANEQANYTITDTRALHSGTYQCKVTIEEKDKTSNTQTIDIKGLQTPVLTVDSTMVKEGETVSVTCRVDNEPGMLKFSLKNGEEYFYRAASSTGQVTRSLQLDAGQDAANLSCSYTILLSDKLRESDISNVVKITVQKLDITLSIKVSPGPEVIEGDKINITCVVSGSFQNLPLPDLVYGEKIVQPSMTNKGFSKDVLAKDTGTYECFLFFNDASRNASTRLVVKELFSQPELTITPSSVFEKDTITVTCISSQIASERISMTDVKYSIYRNGHIVTPGAFDGVYRATAGMETNGNYTCIAQAQNISKQSHFKLFKAKVLVSKPVISVEGKVVLGQNFKIHCHSENGSLPINYTLKKRHRTMDEILVSNPTEKAIFTGHISSEQENISGFQCEARNNPMKDALLSDPLSSLVIVPVGKPLLTVLPTPDDVTEGDDVDLICGIGKGTPPITFTWYRLEGNKLDSKTVNTNHSSYALHGVTSKNSSTYYCEAINDANHKLESDHVTFSVRLARWKKGLIAGGCLLCLSVVVLVLVIRYRAMRVKVYGTGAGVWTERPPAPDLSDGGDMEGHDEAAVEYTEVLHPQSVDPARVPLRKGTDTVYSELQTPSQES